ncbi:hypothetical protein [Bradyrhizobium sp. SZCCHNRI3052]|uniref:SH3 domain-containing protein n=1 Tax=Bradyrhizobium sp. SZCCHNRI3052 TaxID=3057295 RepID=UPI002916AE84|nr:hypothetical protein [Bradyrhizobium sp. SZCCHNRI3052]
MSKMMLLLAAAAALTASPASAFYTECTAIKEIELLNRPDGRTDPRFEPVAKGDKVAFRDEYQGWWFVIHDGTYGWVQKSDLTKCKKMDGTP